MKSEIVFEGSDARGSELARQEGREESTDSGQVLLFLRHRVRAAWNHMDLRALEKGREALRLCDRDVPKEWT